MRIKTSVEAFAALLAFAAVSSGLGCTGQRPARSDGERLYVARCTSCHRAFEPREHEPPEWSRQVGRMISLNKVQLSAGERALILSYLAGTEVRTSSAAQVQRGPGANQPRPR